MTDREKALYAVLVVTLALTVVNIATDGPQIWLLLSSELCTMTAVLLSLRRLRHQRVAAGATRRISAYQNR